MRTTGYEKVTEFDKQVAVDIREDIKKALSAIEKKYGVVLSTQSARYSLSSYKIQLQFDLSEMYEGKPVSTAEKDTFVLYAKQYGLLPDDYGKEVIMQGAVYRIVGIYPKRPKFPITVLDLGLNKRMKAPAAMVVKALGR